MAIWTQSINPVQCIFFLTTISQNVQDIPFSNYLHSFNCSNDTLDFVLLKIIIECGLIELLYWSQIGKLFIIVHNAAAWWVALKLQSGVLRKNWLWSQYIWMIQLPGPSLFLSAVLQPCLQSPSPQRSLLCTSRLWVNRGCHAMPNRGEVWISDSSFAEDGEWFCCPDICLVFVPPLRSQNKEESLLHWVTFVCSQRWRYQPASWCSGAKCLHLVTWSDQCL